jgi:phosphatidylserine decarboxylase
MVLAPAVGLFARAYGADLGEAVRPPGGYRTFLDFFVRRLEPGRRPVPTDPLAVACPADGQVHRTSVVERGMLLQAKGVPYRLADLLDDPAAGARYAGGSALTIHLGPGDYHRFHWPFDVVLDAARHVPGDLWPVMPRAARTVPRLFVRNERVVIEGRTPSGGLFAFVAVGALDVGSIRLDFHPVRTNRGGPARPRALKVEGTRARRGAECGWFEMGSAIVLLLASDAGTLVPLAPGQRVRVGAEVGRLAETPDEAGAR